MTGQAKRKTFISLLLSLLIVTLFTFSLTAARYSEDKKADGQLTGDLEYVVADQIVVSSVDGLLAAIQNGYSNIQIADDVKNPIIVTGTAPDVNSDLTIDLNGHELQRNDRGPMLNVTQGVRLTIIDSAGGGGFYNPVGSVLNIDGGTLTVAAGVFESGPRDGENDGNAINGTIVHGAGNLRQSEYATGSYNAGWSTPAKASIGSQNTADSSVNVRPWQRTEPTEPTDNSGSYVQTTSDITMPVIIPGILEWDTDTNGNQVPVHISGNMYFETNPNSWGGWIADDTYLYFVMEGMGSDVIYTEGSADFYYTYYIQYSDGKYEYYGLSDNPDNPNDPNVFEVTIYGYYNVKDSAAVANHEGISGYSAVNLTDGNLYSRGGNYFSYFGETNTRCVSASGGYMEISNAGTTFEAHGDGVCLDVEYHSPATTEYLTVSNGHFYSRVGDTIAVSGGTMSVSGGEFAKDATEVRQTTSLNPTATAPENGAAIHITGGTLTVDGGGNKIPFNISGSGVAGIWSTGAGSVTVSDATFTFNNYPYINETIPEGGDESSYGGSSYYHNTFGICAAGGTVTATDCKFYMYDRYARGIYANGGTVTLAGNTNISVQGSYSAGILAYGGTINVNDSLTCYVGIGGSTAQTLSSTAISTEGGNIVFNVGTDADGITIDTYGLGITSRQGTGTGNSSSITLASGELNINSHYGTAIYMSGGTLSTAAGTTVEIDSAIDESKKWVTPPGSTGASVGEIYNGVYIQGGNLTANGTFNVSHTGVANTGYANNDDSLTVRSFAVRVEGGSGTSVKIVSGNISSNVITEGSGGYWDPITETAGGGGGLFVSGGMVTLGVDGGDNRNLNISSNGTQTTDGTYGLGSNWNYYGNIRGGPAVQTEGGTLIVNGGTYVAQQGSGILVKNGNVEIYDGSFVGLDAKRLSNDDLIPGAAASYGFKMYGGTVTIWGGSFGSPDEEGSGAFVTWAPYGDDKTPSSKNQAVANIYGGRFEVGGTTGFAVHRNALVTFDPGGPGVVGTNDDILVSGIWTGLTLELRTNGTNYTGDMRGSKVIINGGTFKGKGDATRTTVVNGVWIGESASTMTISGGIFQGYENSYAIDSSRTWNAVLAQDATAEYYRNGSWNVIPTGNLNYNTNSQYSAGEEQTYRYYHVRVTSP